MRIGQISHKGMVRTNNEDSIFSSTKKDLFIVADGMGGHLGGEIASRTAVNKIRYFIKNKFDNYSENKNGVLNLICDAMNYASCAIYTLGKKDDALCGMGTTGVVAVLFDKKIYIGHVGDSRAYLINNKIKQITKDHSLVQELLLSGTITVDEAKNYPHKNIITRALGIDEKVKVDTYNIKLKENEIILLCTDGLTNLVSDKEIFNIVRLNTPNKAVKLLIDEANARGGTDNISVIIIKNENNI